MTPLDDEFRERLTALQGPDTNVAADLVAVRASAGRITRRRRVVTAFAGAVFAMVVVGAVFVVERPNDGHRSVVAGQRQATPTAPTSPPTTAPAVTSGTLPAGVPEIPTSAVTTYQTDVRLTIGGDGFAVGGGSVWVGRERSILRIDDSTGQVVNTIDVGRYSADIALSDDELWVLVDEGRDTNTYQVVRIDTATDTVTARVDLPEATVPRPSSGNAQGHLAISRGSVWISLPVPGPNNGTSTIVRLDARSGTRLASFDVPTPLGDMVGDDDGVWINGFYGPRIWHVDPATNELTEFANVPGNTLFETGFSRDLGVIWRVRFRGNASTDGMSVARIDADGTFRDTGVSATTVMAAKGQVWFLGFADARGALNPPAVGELDPVTGAMRRVAALSYQPTFTGYTKIAIGDDALWILSPDKLTRVATAATPIATEPREERAVVAGVRGGAPPCATDVDGAYGADVAHPDRAPLRAEATLGNGVRWAICGASIVFSGELLNLRSDDEGATWVVTRTPMAESPHHAGDSVDIRLTTATDGTVQLKNGAAPNLDATWVTDDGGLTWMKQ